MKDRSDDYEMNLNFEYTTMSQMLISYFTMIVNLQSCLFSKVSPEIFEM